MDSENEIEKEVVLVNSSANTSAIEANKNKGIASCLEKYFFNKKSIKLFVPTIESTHTSQLKLNWKCCVKNIFFMKKGRISSKENKFKKLKILLIKG